MVQVELWATSSPTALYGLNSANNYVFLEADTLRWLNPNIWIVTL